MTKENHTNNEPNQQERWPMKETQAKQQINQLTNNLTVNQQGEEPIHQGNREQKLELHYQTNYLCSSQEQHKHQSKTKTREKERGKQH